MPEKSFEFRKCRKILFKPENARRKFSKFENFRLNSGLPGKCLKFFKIMSGNIISFVWKSDKSDITMIKWCRFHGPWKKSYKNVSICLVQFSVYVKTIRFLWLSFKKGVINVPIKRSLPLEIFYRQVIYILIFLFSV